MSRIYTALILAFASFGIRSLRAQPLSLPFKPVDVQYSGSLDRLIAISVNPHTVHIVNPVSGAETTINLSLPPLSLSVSPDGTHAAVGHDGWISYVNLAIGYVEKNLPVSVTANPVVLNGNGIVWAPPSATINVGTGIQTTSGYSVWGVNKPALHPNGNWVYYTRGGSPDDVIKGDLSSGNFQYLYDSRYHGDFPVCAGIFFSADGNRLLTGCGTLFRTTASSTDDLTYNGALSDAPTVTAMADSTITHRFAVIPGAGYGRSNADTELQFYDSQYANLLGKIALPTYSSGAITAPWRGRKVFYSSDGTRLYVVLQADSQANLVNDYAVYGLTLTSGNGCGASLGINSTIVAAAGGRVDVNVTATAGCVWQAASNANWLSIVAGGVSSGGGTVSIQTSPNLQTTQRVGTVTIAGLTYTVTQDAASTAGVNPVSVLPARPIAAEYSAALDRMILISTNPNLLTILDPITGQSQTIALVMPPTAVSVSPDGLHAAVGHDGRISYVNLANATVERTFSVTTTVYDLALSAKDVFAFPLRDQWEAIRVVNITTGAETLWNWVYAGSTAGKISPNGKYLYLNATKRYDITVALPSAFDAISSYSPRQWFSQDGSRLFSGSGQAFRLSEIASQDLQYNGTLESSGLAAVADSSTQQVTATVATGATLDSVIKFFGQQYLAAVGSISIPDLTNGANSYKAHGRRLFWNAAGNRLFAVVQADQTSGLLYDYAIYTVTFNGGCNTSLSASNASPSATGGSFTVDVTANSGCAWKAMSNASWLTVTGNAVSAGASTVSYIVDPNPTTSARTATITIDGKTLTVTQAAGSQALRLAVTNLPFRVADAEYSNALNRIVALSGSPNRLNIYDPETGTNTAVALPLPGHAVAVQPAGLRAAVCHDGLVTVVNLQTAAVEKTLNVSVNCYDMAYADNSYVYMSSTGGWGKSSSLNTATGVETTLDLYYNGVNFRLNNVGDAIYTSNTGTSASSVTRYRIASGPMTMDYQSEWYPAHPFGYKIWFTGDGRMVADSGSVFRTGSTLATDFIYTGTLSGFPGHLGSIQALAHSTTRHLFASIGSSSSTSSTDATDGKLFLNGDKYLALSSKVTLPKITVAGASADPHGKFVFWDSAGSKAYVIMQADASAGLLNDYAVYTLSPEFTTGCAVTLGINSATAVAYTDTGSVAVNAASDCVWEVNSNASWIQIDTGTLGVGPGTVSYSVLANPNTVTRQGTVAIGSQTFTVTQAAACLYSLDSNIVSAGKSGGAGSVLVSTAGGCPWTSTSNAGWITITSGSTGSGSGWVGYSVAANSGAARAGSVTIAGQTFTINQDGVIVQAGVGIFRAGLWVIDHNSNGQWDGPGGGDRFSYLGQTGDRTVIGDWNGDGKSKTGIFRAGQWVLDYNGNGQWDGASTDRFFYLGEAGDTPVVGDWNGDGRVKPGIFRNGLWVLDYNGNGQWDGPMGGDRFFYLGQAGDIPVIGDWSGDGRAKAGVFRNGQWILDYNGNGVWDGLAVDRLLYLGQAGDAVVLGDWNGDRRTKVGVFRAGLWVLDYNGNGQWDGPGVDRFLYLGQSGDAALVGDWNGDGRSKAGIFRGGLWVIDKNGNGVWDGPPADAFFYLGQAGDAPLVGKW